jgi:hypothetical protein
VARKKTGGSGQMVAFRLPKDLHDKLATASEATHGEGVSEEIRRRLEASFRGSDASRHWQDAIGRVIRAIEDAYGADWYKNAFAKRVVWQWARQVFGSQEDPEFQEPRQGSFIARMAERENFRDADTLAFMLQNMFPEEDVP